MALFRCTIRGDNFPGKLIKTKGPVGFYTTRFVEADSPEKAEMLAVELLRNDPDLQVPEKYKTQDAKVYFEKVEEVHVMPRRYPNRGFTFFTSES